MFDLDKAVAHWLRGLSQRSGFSPEDLEELETHIRDHVEARAGSGFSEKEAFLDGIRRFGDPHLVASEYRKMAWTKTRRATGMLRASVAEAAMLTSYAKVGFRNLARQRAFAAINIFGLGIGLACFLLIALFVRYELRYDRHHAAADRIYRVSREWRDQDGRPMLALARISMPIGPSMEKELPEVEKAVRLLQFEAPIASGDQRYVEPNVFAVDSGFFDVFSAQLVRGDPRMALTAPNTIVLTEPMAEKYFGSDDPIGQSLRVFDDYDLVVTGVAKAQPHTSHFHPAFLISFGTTTLWTDESERNDWGQYNNYATYVLLSEQADPDAVQAKLPGFLRAHFPADNTAEDALLLQPLTGIHLDSHLTSELEPNGNRSYVILFGAVAILVLLIACFNFINLATARSSGRSKEVGMRKALGADRRQLVGQFLGESGIMTALSFACAVGFVWFLLPTFSRLTGQSLSFSDVGVWQLLAGSGSIVLLVSLLAGAYPALYLSRFKPVDVFRPATGGSWRSHLRSVLVISQFAISIVLIVGMGVVMRQVSYVQNKDLGFEKDHLVALPATLDMRSDFERFRKQLEASPAIREVTASKLIPSGSLVDHVGVRAEVDGAMETASLSLNPVDHEFVETYGMRLAAGRSFSKQLASDSTEAFVINESAVKLLGWTSSEEAIGKPFIMEARSFTRPGTVIGVVKDFHFESLRHEIAPLVLFIMPERFNRVTVRIAPGRIEEALAFLEACWVDWRPDYPFAYSFVDQDFGALYEADRKVERLFSYFAILAMAIATLGLLGLATFVMDRRRKEIGVRKVLGASVSTIVGMLSFDFLRLIGFAFVVAAPVAYLVVNWWLDRFAYHTELTLWLFVLAGGVVTVIALTTVSIQSFRTAMVDPVMSLRQD